MSENKRIQEFIEQETYHLQECKNKLEELESKWMVTSSTKELITFLRSYVILKAEFLQSIVNLNEREE